MSLSDVMYHLHKGTLYTAYEHFGAHVMDSNEGMKTRFRVYAPNAESIDLVGSFNDYALGAHPMEKVDDAGVFETSLEGDLTGERYKYAILSKQGERLYKSDPFAFYSANRPDTVSRVARLDFSWGDGSYMRRLRESAPYDKPVSIYEVHLGSWMRKPDGGFHSYRELAGHLIPYVASLGFSHIELMPIIEHPFDGSWGYQGTGYYSVTSRYGSPEDFAYFVDAAHQAGIGVIVDWVPGHICKDAHGLYRFDGSFLYEYDDDSIRENPVWGTANLDLGKGETRSFLISNALFFMRKYHIDGFRIDAVSNIVYYMGESDRGVNEGALAFLRALSKAVFAECDGAILAAEDSSAFPKVTHPIEHGGLGFNYKWNMGWMNDTLKYFQKDPIYRKHHHSNLTFSLMYAFTENFILPFSHDEVVHGKGSLVDKMPGDYWQKFANYRALIGYLFTHPGKPLLFMGSEFAQMNEWNDADELDWQLLSYPVHDSARRFTRDMNRVMHAEKALHEADHVPEGFEWIDADNADESVISFVRYSRGREEMLVVVLNLTPTPRHDFPLGVPRKGTYHEIVNSDKNVYAGSNLFNGAPRESIDEPMHGRDQHIRVLLAPLSISILKWEG